MEGKSSVVFNHSQLTRLDVASVRPEITGDEEEGNGGKSSFSSLHD